jgi:hypothetical protein
MPGKRVQFDDDTWEAIEAVTHDSGESFQELADEAFKDLLEKRKQPVGLKAALEESVAHPKDLNCPAQFAKNKRCVQACSNAGS